VGSDSIAKEKRKKKEKDKFYIISPPKIYHPYSLLPPLACPPMSNLILILNKNEPPVTNFTLSRSQRLIHCWEEKQNSPATRPQE
jgi:hypothetical protein